MYNYFTDNRNTATEQINFLKETAGKDGLQISEKTEFMTDIKNTPRFLDTQYGKINKVKYLGEIL